MSKVAGKRLYIIGNGFDLYHKLPTKYADFHKFILQCQAKVQVLFDTYFQLKFDKEYLWTDFENDLGTFKWRTFYEDINNIDVLDDHFKPSSIYSLEDNITQETDEMIDLIREAFENWLSSISLDFVTPNLTLDTSSKFLNFNYTMTLEEVYYVANENILHIHGDVENSQGSLIFGHNKRLKRSPKFDTHGESTRTLFSDSEDMTKYPFYAFRKPVTDIISENKDFFNYMVNVEEVIVLGHSLNSVDIPYFRKIEKICNAKIKWRISYFNDLSKAKLLTSFQKIGVATDRIEFFKMDDLRSGKL